MPAPYKTPPIIYEDNHLLLAAKPPGIPSQSGRTAVPDMLELLKRDLEIRYRKPGKAYLGLVHRLDQPVSGLMVFAKTSKAASPPLPGFPYAPSAKTLPGHRQRTA